MMEIKEYQEASYTNIQPHENDKDTVLNWCIGLSEEVGETFNHIKHKYWGNEDINVASISKELGDILWYLSALCSSLNISLETVAKLNIEKLLYRYNEDFSESKSKNRKENEKKFEQTDIYKSLLTKINLH